VRQLKSAWTRLDRRKQIIAGGAALAVFLGVLLMSRMSARQDMALLYAGLETSSAGDVITALEQRNAHFEVRGDSIYVASGQRDSLRMTLAGEGLPSNGSRGYELLDSLTGFGTTSQMFDAAYWRAKEGELARTIIANPRITQARVHIASNGTNPFRRTVEPTASVSLTTAGPALSKEQARAIQYLVASAVPGLIVENVAVVDATGIILTSQGDSAQPAAQDDRAEVLRERVLRLLEARVGPGNAVVEVSVDTVTETETMRERRVDPDSRVIVSTESQERSNTSSGIGGNVTVASNLPDTEDGGETAQSRNDELRESVTYRVSETELEVHKAPGAIRRVTVAVLVNGLKQADEDGEAVHLQRPEEELEALRQLVASAVGFDPKRGDQITLKSMELPAAEPLGTAAEPGLLSRLGVNPMPLMKMALIGAVTLALGLFVVRPILIGSPGTAAPAPVAETAQRSGDDMPERPALTGEIDESPGSAAERANLPAPRAETQVESSPAGDRLRALIAERQDESLEILRGWLEDKETT